MEKKKNHVYLYIVRYSFFYILVIAFTITNYKVLCTCYISSNVL